jgi:hypothetical protein
LLPVAPFSTPDEAVLADDTVPARYARIVAVEYAPDRHHAVVFVAYNEPPHIEPYVVLCEQAEDGWSELHGGSGGGISWMATAEDGSVGVETRWQPPTARWGVPASAVSEPHEGQNTW